MALAALALVAAVASWLARAPRAEPRAIRLAVTLPDDVSFSELGGLDAASLALSPDGSRLVYAGVRDSVDQLFLRELSSTESVPLRGTKGATQPFFSPDGRWIGFAADGRLKKALLTGDSSPVTLCDFEYILLGASWSTEDEVLFAIMGQGLMKVSAAGGEPVSLAAVDAGVGELRRGYPDVLPAGRGALLAIAHGGDEEGNISLLVPGSPTPRAVIERGLIAKFSSTGHIVFTREGTLFATAVDPGTLETIGAPVPIAEGVQRYRDFALSREGTLAFIAGPMETRSDLRLVRVDRNGTPEDVAGAPRSSARSNPPRLSPDGTRIALGVSYVVEGPDVFLLELDRNSLRRLTFSEGPSGGVGPVWSADGTRVYFASDRVDGIWRTFVTAADGSTEARLVSDWDAYHRPTSISPDGKTLVLRLQSESGDWDIGLLTLGDEGSGKPESLLATSYEETSGMVSPDGRFLAYVSDESGREEVYLQPFPDLGSKRKVSVDGGNEPLWSRDGRELFYRTATQMMAVDVVTERDVETGKPRALFDDPYYRSREGRAAFYDVSPNGNFFYMFQPIEPESKPREVQIVLNWPALLERETR